MKITFLSILILSNIISLSAINIYALNGDRTRSNNIIEADSIVNHNFIYEDDSLKQSLDIDGKVVSYHSSTGNVRSIFYFNNGKENAPSEFYNKDGVLITILNYKNGNYI